MRQMWWKPSVLMCQKQCLLSAAETRKFNVIKGMHECCNSSPRFRLYEAWKISRREGARARARGGGRGKEGEITEELSRLLSPTFFIRALPLPPFHSHSPSLLALFLQPSLNGVSPFMSIFHLSLLPWPSPSIRAEEKKHNSPDES